MQNVPIIQSMTLGMLMVVNAAAQAAMDQTYGPVVYEEMTWAQGKNHYVKPFSIGQTGSYHAELTDFAFPDPIQEIGMAIIGSPFEQTGKLGETEGTGGFNFQATAGDYYLAVYYDVSGQSSDVLPLSIEGGDDLGLFGIQISQMSAVPIPAAMLFLASGMGLIHFVRRRTESSDVATTMVT